jgi:AraC-like DNA-binding protein
MPLLVRAACLTNYSEVARAGGLDPGAMLARAGLSPGIESTPDLMIPVDRVGRLLHESALLADNEAFGLCMAESRRLSNLGAVGLLVRDQATLRDSLDVLVRHQGLLNGSLTLMLEQHADLVVLREELRSARPLQPTRQRIELALGVMLRLMRQFLGAAWQPRRVHLAHPAPRDLRVHHRVLCGRIEFDSEFNGIVCARADLDAPNPSADPGMARYAAELLAPTLPRRPATLAQDVRRAVLLLLPGGRCSIEQVGAHLGVSKRSAQRALAEQGLTFSLLLNEIRRELAARHVRDSDRPLTEVALLLGFAAPSAFSRWHQAQFACTARAVRAARGASGSAAAQDSA